MAKLDQPYLNASKLTTEQKRAITKSGVGTRSRSDPEAAIALKMDNLQ